MALYMTIVMGGTPIGAPIIGLLGQHLGARWSLAIGGALTLLGVLLAVVTYARLVGGWTTLSADLRRERAARSAPVSELVQQAS